MVEMGWWLALVILVVFSNVIQPDPFCDSMIQGWAACVWWAWVLE